MRASKTTIHEMVIGILSTGYSPKVSAERDVHAYGNLVSLLVDDIYAEGYQEDVIRAGMDIFRREWTFAKWPVFAQLNEFFKRAAAKTALPSPPPPNTNPERWAERLMQSNDGQKAIRDGLQLALWEWAILNQGQWPQEPDWRDMIEVTATRRRHAVEIAANPGQYTAANALLHIVAGMEKREHDIAQRFRRERAA